MVGRFLPRVGRTVSLPARRLRPGSAHAVAFWWTCVLAGGRRKRRRPAGACGGGGGGEGAGGGGGGGSCGNGGIGDRLLLGLVGHPNVGKSSMVRILLHLRRLGLNAV